MVQCPECYRDFKTSKAMKKHHTTEHNAHLLRFHCEWCNTKYISEANLQRHARLKHPDFTVKIPEYSIFSETPRLTAEPVTSTPSKVSGSTYPKFRVVPGHSRYKGAPAKLIKHQPVKDRPISPAVPPSPATPDTSGTPLKDESFLSTLGHLEAVNQRLLTDPPRVDTNQEELTARMNSVCQDLATTSDEASPNTSATRTSRSNALKRKSDKTPVTTGSKRARTAPTISPINTEVEQYNPYRPWIGNPPKKLSSTPKGISSDSTPITSSFSSVGSLSLSFNSSGEMPKTFSTIPNYLNTGWLPKSPAPANIYNLSDALMAHSSATTPPPVTSPTTNTNANQVGTQTSSSDEDTTIPDREVLIFKILDLVERFDSSKTNVMRDMLDILFPANQMS